MIARDVFDRIRHARTRKLDAAARNLLRARRARGGQAGAPPQPRQHPRDLLRLRFVLGLARRFVGERERRVEALATLEHAHAPLPAAGPCARRIRVERAAPVRAALARTTDRVRQLRAPHREPRVPAVDRGGRLDERRERRVVGPRIELLAACVQLQIRIDVAAPLERARRRRERDRLVLKQPEIGEHELRPVLMQIAEEHQPQPVAERVDGHTQHAVVDRRQPLRPWALAVVARAQRVEPVGLAQRAARRRIGKCVAQLGLRREREQRVERKHRLRIDPAERDEGAAAANGQPISS